jgi:ankyrin repeat protein
MGFYDDMVYTVLNYVCRGGVPDVVKWLLNHGADPNPQGCRNWPPLIIVANYGHLEVVQMLLEHNADIHIWNDSGMTPLHKAASGRSDRDQVDIMQVLLHHSAIIDAEDNDGMTPFQVALKFGHDNNATWLKEHGATW